MRVNSLFRGIVIAFIITTLVPACDRPGTPRTEHQPRWQKIVDASSLDDSKDIQMLIGAVDRSPSQEISVILVLTCMQGNTDAYVVWHRYLGVFDPEVTWQVGSDLSVTETWVLSTDNEATFASEPVKLIKQMMNNDLFLIKTTPPGSAPVTVEFNTAGLETEITELRETCAW